jgi:hypothetical protein
MYVTQLKATKWNMEVCSHPGLRMIENERDLRNVRTLKGCFQSVSLFLPYYVLCLAFVIVHGFSKLWNAYHYLYGILLRPERNLDKNSKFEKGKIKNYIKRIPHIFDNT